jgi:thiol-disulfide isomerase/thioredoxin
MSVSLNLVHNGVMKTRTLLAASLIALPIFAATSQPSTQSSGNALLDRIHADTPPKFDRTKQSDRDYVMQYMTQIRAWGKEKAAMEAEFLKASPDHPEAEKIRGDRWMMMASFDDPAKVKSEAEAYLADPKHKDDATALFTLAAMGMRTPDRSDPMPAIERFIAAHPKDPRGAQLLFSVAQRPGQSPNQALIDRIMKDYPDSDAARMAAGANRQATAVGKPFELEFNDATTGKHIAMKDLKGKVVVVDFWATWCGPCVAEMPEMKRIYSEYKDKGVEFIGVSLDQPEKEGGLDALKEFVKTNEIPWPQYYQGDSWGGKFTASWGINSIPTVFVVDQDGNLFTTAASRVVEPILKQLLANKAKAAQ